MVLYRMHLNKVYIECITNAKLGKTTTKPNKLKGIEIPNVSPIYHNAKLQEP